MFADSRCMQCMEIFKNFVELFVVFRNELDAPFSLFHATLRTVQYKLKSTHRTEAVVYFWKHKHKKADRYVCIYIIRKLDVGICFFFHKGTFGHLKAACFEFCQFQSTLFML